MEQKVRHMKPERVQPPSIFPQADAASSGVTWKVNTGSFETSCGVAKVMSDMLQNSKFQKTLNLSDEWIELWLSNATPEDRAALCRLIPRLKGAVEHYLEESGVHQEQAEILGA